MIYLSFAFYESLELKLIYIYIYTSKWREYYNEIPFPIDILLKIIWDKLSPTEKFNNVCCANHKQIARKFYFWCLKFENV